MAQRQVAARSGDVFESIEDWIGRRNAEAGRFAREAEARGRQLWNDATRTGQDVLGRTRSELRALGAAADRSPTAKFLGGQVAESVGRGVGVGRGVAHSVEGVARAAPLLELALNPTDLSLYGPLISRTTASANAIGNYVSRGIADPASVGRDIGDAVHQFHVGMDPLATPMADSFAGEMKRRAKIGANQGELGWDVGTLVAGTPALKVVERLGAVADATSAAEFMRMGFTPAQAERLARPYNGLGHHSPISQSLAKTLRLPDWIRDSSFNVIKRDGINQGDFYKLHFQTDPDYYGSGFSRQIGGPGWSGKRLGLQKYGLLNRFWYGTPTPLASVSAALGSAGLANYEPEDPAQ